MEPQNQKEEPDIVRLSLLFEQQYDQILDKYYTYRVLDYSVKPIAWDMMKGRKPYHRFRAESITQEWKLHDNELKTSHQMQSLYFLRRAGYQRLKVWYSSKSFQ